LQSIPALVMESYSIERGPRTARSCVGSAVKTLDDMPFEDDILTDYVEDSDSCSTSSSSHFDFSSGAEAATKDSEQPPSDMPEQSLTLPLPRRGQPMYPEVAGMYVRAAETPRSLFPSPFGAMYVQAHLTPKAASVAESVADLSPLSCRLVAFDGDEQPRDFAAFDMPKRIMEPSPSCSLRSYLVMDPDFSDAAGVALPKVLRYTAFGARRSVD